MRTVKRVFGWTLIDKYTKRPATAFPEHESQGLWDMLRYDAAFINPKFPQTIITLTVNIRGRGVLKGTTTPARWSSFGYSLQATTAPELVSDEWVTYIHPTDANRRTDYTALAPITLKAWLALDDLR